jgi:ABC-type lipoprotein export system ATPase subunit
MPASTISNRRTITRVDGFPEQRNSRIRNFELILLFFNGVLWIKAKLGAGKSTLMKNVWLHLKESSNAYLLAAYSFHGRGHIRLERNASGMISQKCIVLLVDTSDECDDTEVESVVASP